MSDVSCQNCGKRYRIDEKTITGKSVKFKCKSCRHIVVFTAPQTTTSVFKPNHSKAGTTKIKGINRIQVKISLILVSLIILIMAIYAGINYTTQKTKMSEEIVYLSDILTHRLSKHLAEPFWALDDVMLKEMLKSEMLDKQIFAIHIIDRDNKTIFMGMKRNNSWAPVVSDSYITGDFTIKREPVIRNKETIGSVETYLTKQFMEKEFEKSMLSIYFTAIGLIVIISIIIYFTLNRIIITPIRNLTIAADRVSTGDLDVKITVTSKDEIGLLAQAFSRLQTSIRFAMERLKK